MLSHISKISSNEKQNKLLKSIDYLHILVYDQNNDQFIKMVNSLISRSNTLKLMTRIDSTNQLVEVYFADGDDATSSEFMMFIREADSNVLVYIVGEFDMGQISDLTNLRIGR